MLAGVAFDPPGEETAEKPAGTGRCLEQAGQARAMLEVRRGEGVETMHGAVLNLVARRPEDEFDVGADVLVLVAERRQQSRQGVGRLSVEGVLELGVALQWEQVRHEAQLDDPHVPPLRYFVLLNAVDPGLRVRGIQLLGHRDTQRVGTGPEQSDVRPDSTPFERKRPASVAVARQFNPHRTGLVPYRREDSSVTAAPNTSNGSVCSCAMD